VYDSPSNIPTFSFAYGAKFHSKYLVFSTHELESNVSINKNGSPYQALQSVSGPLESAFSSIGSGGYPFLDYGGKLAQVGSEEGTSTTDVAALQGLSWNQVLTKLRNPKSAVTQLVLGGANYVTAATCFMTGSKPAAVCNSSRIKTLESQLAASA
jgi:hypothetical protein